MSRRELLAAGALALLTALLYAPVRHFPFISYDDPFYVTENPHLAHGLSPSGLRWALWNDYGDNWLPITWLSHLADRQLFDLRPGPHHAVNAALHVGNSVLLFIFLARATGCFWRAWIVAALFAVHPLRVESVAWVSERKDVLSGLFFMLTLLAYLGYAHRPSYGRYALVALAYAAAVMAKPMVVTLPCVLLLLDVWPLRRVTLAPGTTSSWKRIVLEKLPLLAMAAALSVATVYVQKQVGAVKGTEQYTMPQRLGNATVAYVRYVQKSAWPTGLSVFYPHPGRWPAGQIAAAAIALAIVTFAAWRVRERAPYVLVGWLWFVGTLVPVIGIVQVGDQSMADRYTYLPGIGLMLVIVWGAADLLQRTARNPAVVGGSVAGVVIVTLSIATARQLKHWEGGSITLFSHAANVTADNWLAHRHLGSALADAGDFDGAEANLRAALRVRPTSAQVHYNYGNLLVRQRRFDDAVAAYRKAVALDPTFHEAHNSLGAALASAGRFDESGAAFRAAIDAAPTYADAHANLGVLLASQGRHAEAVPHFHNALRLRPNFPLAQRGLEKSLAAQNGPSTTPSMR
jgi:Tfp pilus assembly protein PilF